jgi:hypothetical protein
VFVLIPATCTSTFCPFHNLKFPKKVEKGIEISFYRYSTVVTKPSFLAVFRKSSSPAIFRIQKTVLSGSGTNKTEYVCKKPT